MGLSSFAAVRRDSRRPGPTLWLSHIEAHVGQGVSPAAPQGFSLPVVSSLEGLLHM